MDASSLVDNEWIVEGYVEPVSDLEKRETAGSSFVDEGEEGEADMLEDEDEVLLIVKRSICFPSVMLGNG